MSSFEKQINELRQYIIAVKVFAPAKNKDDYNKIEKNATGYRALVDTGANRCSISREIVTDLNLKPHSQSSVTTAGGIHVTPVYMVGISVAIRETQMHPEKQKDGTTTMKPSVVSELSKGFPEIQVITFPDCGPGRSFDMILGMDMLMHFHITMCLGKIIISI